MNGFDPTQNEPADTTPGPGAYSTGDPYAASNAGVPPSAAAGAPYAPGYGTPGAVPPPPASGLPNPALATFLGFIPGVGAMYNGQFAKGLAQIVIFAVLVSLADHVNGIFGLLVTGWIFYMVFDAYQTARARRDGLQVPDPFGLNNIGERMGIGNGPNWSDFTARPIPGQAPPASGTHYAAPAPPYAAAGTNHPSNAAPYAADPTYGQSAEYVPPVYAQSSASAGTFYPETPYPQAGYAPPTAAYAPPVYPSAPPYAPPSSNAAAYAPPLPPLVAAGGLPTGALWLIGLGVFALAGTLSHRFSWSNRFLDGAIVLAIGLAVLITRVLRARTVYPSGSAAATWYILRSMRLGLILIAVGVGLTLDHVGILNWNGMWPWLLILLGVFLLLERAAHNRMLAAGPVSPFGMTPEDTPTYATSNSFVPQPQARDEEGR